MKTLIFIGLLLMSSLSLAEGDEDATKSTQNLLRSSKERKELIKHDDRAKEADHQVDQITGGDGHAKEEMYDISAALMPWLVEQSGGDSDKMNALLEEALKNPQKFIDSMPESERARIKAISGRLEKNKIKP